MGGGSGGGGGWGVGAKPEELQKIQTVILLAIGEAGKAIF